jgi:hypothetical protein
MKFCSSVWVLFWIPIVTKLDLQRPLRALREKLIFSAQQQKGGAAVRPLSL